MQLITKQEAPDFEWEGGGEVGRQGGREAETHDITWHGLGGATSLTLLV